MNDRNNPDLKDYVTIKEAAVILKLKYSVMHHHVTEGHIPSLRAGHSYLIHVDDIKNFKPKIAGRPRTTVPLWRISPEDNLLRRTLIHVQIRKGRRNALLKKLDEIRQKKEEHLFHGTLARYITDSQKHPDTVEIALIWRVSVMPEEPARQAALESFRQELADVLDWETAEYDEGTVLMHT
jgi:excisionase family DNA binding protein